MHRRKERVGSLEFLQNYDACNECWSTTLVVTISLHLPHFQIMNRQLQSLSQSFLVGYPFTTLSLSHSESKGNNFVVIIRENRKIWNNPCKQLSCYTSSICILDFIGQFQKNNPKKLTKSVVQGVYHIGGDYGPRI